MIVIVVVIIVIIVSVPLPLHVVDPAVDWCFFSLASLLR